MTLTPQERLEVDALRAYMETRRYDLAAKRVGTTVPALQARLHRMRRRYGVDHNTIGLVYALRDAGILDLTWKV